MFPCLNAATVGGSLSLLSSRRGAVLLCLRLEISSILFVVIQSTKYTSVCILHVPCQRHFQSPQTGHTLPAPNCLPTALLYPQIINISVFKVLRSASLTMLYIIVNTPLLGLYGI